MLSWTSKICKEYSRGKFPAMFSFRLYIKIIVTKQHLENYTLTRVAKIKNDTIPVPSVDESIE